MWLSLIVDLAMSFRLPTAPGHFSLRSNIKQVRAVKIIIANCWRRTNQAPSAAVAQMNLGYIQGGLINNGAWYRFCWCSIHRHDPHVSLYLLSSKNLCIAHMRITCKSELHDTQRETLNLEQLVTLLEEEETHPIVWKY